MVAFAIKAPLYPFHGWVPDAYRESPPEVAALLSGVVSKAGAYGMLRFALPLFPGPAPTGGAGSWRSRSSGLLWCSLVAFRQPDSRGVIAYSSIAQMSLIALGIFVMNDIGATGATFQMVNHGLLSVAAVPARRRRRGALRATGLFRRSARSPAAAPALATIVHDRRHRGARGARVGALRVRVPRAAGRVPATGWLIGALASLAIVLAAMYMLRWISAVLHDAPAEPAPGGSRGMRDLRWEAVYLLPLIACVLALSVYPYAVTHRVSLSMHGIVSAVTARRAP